MNEACVRMCMNVCGECGNVGVNVWLVGVRRVTAGMWWKACAYVRLF